MIDAERVRAALTRAGRPDLARKVGTNKGGDAMIKSCVHHYLSDDDLTVLWQALRSSRGEAWAQSSPALDSADKFVEFCRAAPPTANRDRLDVDHWCPIYQAWCKLFHRKCWEEAA